MTLRRPTVSLRRSKFIAMGLATCGWESTGFKSRIKRAVADCFHLRTSHEKDYISKVCSALKYEHRVFEMHHMIRSSLFQIKCHVSALCDLMRLSD
jgi:hypothetical protein